MKNITLRFLCKNDLKDTFDLLQNPKVMQYIGPRRPLTDDEVTEWFDTEINNPSRFVITSIKSDEIIGFCGIKEIDGVLDFGYFLREVFWNQGYATEACRQALLKLATTINISDIEIFIAADNSASQSIAKKLNWSRLSTVQRNHEIGHLYAVSG